MFFFSIQGVKFRTERRLIYNWYTKDYCRCHIILCFAFYNGNNRLCIVDYVFVSLIKNLCVSVLIFYITSLQKRLNQQEKAQYIHVSRWFDNIQQEDKLRGEFETISFNLLHLFL